MKRFPRSLGGCLDVHGVNFAGVSRNTSETTTTKIGEKVSLQGEIAVVTGGAKRIGRAISLALAKAGADVTIHYGSSVEDAEKTAAEVRRAGVRSTTVSADLAEPQSAADRIFEETVATLGAPTILINSAAIFAAGTVRNTTPADWERHLHINLQSPFSLLQRFVAELPADRSGSVVNIVDWRAHVHPPGHLAYTVSKTGLLAMSRMAAQELAPQIRVNAIAPGPMLPPPGQDDSYLKPVVDKLPMQRQGSPEDIARAVVYLCSEPFVTGTLLHVDGGQQFSGGMA